MGKSILRPVSTITVDLTGVNRVIVLCRVLPNRLPDYCVHGMVACMGDCGFDVFLGNNSMTMVAGGQARPFCEVCAERFANHDALGRVTDHLRKDGRHP